MGIAGNEWGFQVGTLPKGARDKISDCLLYTSDAADE